jgi:hypothetical protein
MRRLTFHKRERHPHFVIFLTIGILLAFMHVAEARQNNVAQEEAKDRSKKMENV